MENNYQYINPDFIYTTDSPERIAEKIAALEKEFFARVITEVVEKD
jgi:hypothetical protein